MQNTFGVKKVRPSEVESSIPGSECMNVRQDHEGRSREERCTRPRWRWHEQVALIDEDRTQYYLF